MKADCRLIRFGYAATTLVDGKRMAFISRVTRSILPAFLRLLVPVTASAALLVFATSYTAHACIVSVPFDEQIIDRSEVIFRGHVVAYELSDLPSRHAELTFEVAETYKGNGAPMWIVLWGNSTFRLPDDLAEFSTLYGEDIVVGLSPMDTSDLSEDEIFMARLHFPKLLETPWVMQTHCAPRFMGDFAYFEPMLRSRGLLD